MPTVKFTVKAVEKISAPDPSGKQTLYWDTELKGFGILVSGVSNSKSYVAQRGQRVVVGPCNVFKLDDARERARKILADLRSDVTPEQRAMETITVQQAMDQMIAKHNLRPASVALYKSVVRIYLHGWADLQVRSITPRMVQERHEDLTKRLSKSTANTAIRVFRLLYNYVADTAPNMPPNPAEKMKRRWHKEKRRERMVKFDDMPAFYRAVLELDNTVARDLIIFLMHTGTRVTEAASLEWSSVDFAARVVRVPEERTKGKRTLVLPMTTHVRDLLVARRQIGGQYVFPSGKGKHIIGADHQFKIVAKATGVGVSHHDLRRGFCSVADSVGVGGTTLKRLINHATNDITEGYIVQSIEQQRVAAQKIGDEIVRLCEVEALAGNNVVSAA